MNILTWRLKNQELEYHITNSEILASPFLRYCSWKCGILGARPRAQARWSGGGNTQTSAAVCARSQTARAMYACQCRINTRSDYRSGGSMRANLCARCGVTLILDMSLVGWTPLTCTERVLDRQLIFRCMWRTNKLF